MDKFKVTYKRGLGAPAIVEADSIEAAEKAGLAEFRRVNGTGELLDFRPASQVIEAIEQVFS